MYIMSSNGAGVSFISSGYVPQSTPQMEGFTANVGILLGEDNNFDWTGYKATSINASYNQTWVKEDEEYYSAYGYLYNEFSNAIYNEHTLEDINRDKDVPPTRQTKSLAIPTATYDMFNVAAQGMGGTFRPYRSDLGIYTEPRITSTIYGGAVATEFGFPAPGSAWAKLGIDGSYIQSQSYSGMWFNHFWVGNGNQGWNDIDDNVFQGVGTNGSYNGDFLYQPFYFKMAGELSSRPTTQLDFMGGSAAVRFKLEEPFESGNDICPRPEIRSDHLFDGSNETDLPSYANHLWTRQKTVTRNISRTNAEMGRFAASVPANIYSTRNSFPVVGGTANPSKYDYATKLDNHLAEFTETGADGSRYIYGIPVYAFDSKDVMFAKHGLTQYTTDFITTYDADEASVNNDELNTDKLYSSTTIPGYATTYLLTEVLSPDYVDVTGDGPTEDDLGYYTKFNYVIVDSDFKWRAPYSGAIINAGHLSDENDDKLSYQCGGKQIYVLHSVETKTHVACFFLQANGRSDGHAAIAEFSPSHTSGQVAGADEQFALDHISLYSKNDPNYGTANATPIKSVFFTYDYSLCPGVYNNENTGTSTGKLTLKEIYFTYRNNEKGKLSPYKFDYIDQSYISDLQNPTYDPKGNDRWGTYQQQSPTSNILNYENPYTNQRDRTRADQSAAAWSLKKITLPSGSTIDIEYEADDYGYVQDKKSMQMCRVVGVGEATSGMPATSDITDKLKKKNKRVYFELSEPILNNSSAVAEVYKYMEAIDELYFKLFMDLKAPYANPTGASLQDYVDGYCKIDKSAGSYGVVDNGSSPHIYGFFTINLVDRDDYPNIPNATQVHPFEKATWQYIYLERPDLFVNPNVATPVVSNLIGALTSSIVEIPRVVAPYITANARGWGNKIDINTSSLSHDNRPSYVRLNCPNGSKVGGGHRVKQVTVRDEWADLSGNAGTTGEYGQTYTYKLNNGSSSGVASYEPLIGGEENPLVMPLRYNSDNLVKKDGAFYVTEPLGESYYPAPVVGYRRVIVSSIVTPGVGETVTTSRTGKTEYEFYTAKDYPVQSDRTDLQKTWFPVPVLIPYVGSISYNMRGFSQGYSIVLNDMHGKLKAVATYPSYADLVGSTSMPTRRVFYKYNGGYDANLSNSISSTVDVLTADGVYGQANLGETYDFFFDLRQHSNETQELGLQTNFEFNPILPGIVPTFMPTINISKSLYRSAVAMKVIYRTGILTEVETMDDGAKSTARNLMFDAETGAPLLTVVENEFERPVYTYNYAAHWAYDGMGSAYKNQGARFNGFTTTNGNLSVANADQYFFPGDEIMYIPSSGPGSVLWVTTVSSATVGLIDATGASVGNITGDFIIHRSGRRNLQSVSDGVIVSLSNPVTSRTFPLFDAFNSYTGTSPEGNTLVVPNFYTDCATGVSKEVTLIWNNGILTFWIDNGECQGIITFPAGHGIANLADALTWDLQFAGGTVTATKGTTTLSCDWNDAKGCFTSCLDDVLHASAVRFAENWSVSTPGHQQEINFADVGASSSGNDYKDGLRGVWRTHSNYLYQVDRKQTTASLSGTNISKDGTYDNFVLYNWEIAPQDNTNWSFVSAVTRYSPYGYALETRDALGIYSSVMYGYENTKQTAAAANCQYFEMAFDGFEDYASAYTGHGHMLFTDVAPGVPTGLDALYAHTGKYSYAVQNGGNAEFIISSDGTYAANQQYFECQPGQEYFFSVWARSDNGGTPAVIINTGTPVTFTPDMSKSAIDGWRKIDARFVAPASGTFTITLSCQTTGQANFDDIRIQPFKSAMTSYVYDSQTHWLLAELDNRNFATFYNYDEEGALVQVKQETEKGIFTVQTSRGNIKRQ